MKNLLISAAGLYRDGVSANVLVAEDNPLQAEVIRRYLENDGHSVTTVGDGFSAITEVRRSRPDLVVLDIMMPGLDGLEVCRRLRRESNILLLMLTARSTENDLLLGLDTGADDYLTKPYSARELVARVRTLLRRSGRPETVDRDVLRAGDLTVDRLRRVVSVDGRAVDITAVEFEILVAMVAHPERVFTREQLLERTCGFDRHTGPRTIDVHVRNLRRKLETAPGRPSCLVTVFGVGYKISADPPSKPIG